MTETPGVGAPSNDVSGSCAYTGPADGPPTCTQRATVHIRTTSPNWGEVALAACPEHAPIARRSGHVVAEHPHEGWCGMPGTVWTTDNRCAVDDSGVEPAARVDAADRG